MTHGNYFMVLNTGLKYSNENLIYLWKIEFIGVIMAKAVTLAVVKLLTGDSFTSAVIFLAYSLLNTKKKEGFFQSVRIHQANAG